jgi:hypothetical protein
LFWLSVVLRTFCPTVVLKRVHKSVVLRNLLSCHTWVTYCRLTRKDGFADMKALGPQAMWPAHRRDCDLPASYRAASTAAALARCVCKRVVRVCQERVRCSSWGLPLQV